MSNRAKLKSDAKSLGWALADLALNTGLLIVCAPFYVAAHTAKAIGRVKREFVR